MEHGFYHPERGYWQAIGGDAAELLLTYPDGTIQVPIKPGSDYGWQDGEWIRILPAPSLDYYRQAIDDHVEDIARSKDYNDAATLAGYVNSTVSQWAADAAAFVAWRDAVWIYAFSELAEVQAGQRPQPTVQDFIEELPSLVWPELT